MEQKSTSQLVNVLKSSHMGDIPQYQQQFLQDVPVSFAAYMDELVKAKGLKRQDIFQRADLPQKYGYKLLTGESHTVDRDKLLRIFLAMKLSLKETQRALELYGLPPLYPKKVRDAILIIAINRSIGSVDEVNEILEAHGEPTLSRCRDE